MTKDHQYIVWQPLKCLGEFKTYEAAEHFQQSMVAMGATDVRIYDLDLKEVKEKPSS